MRGKVIKGIAGFYYIHAEDGNVYACRARGIFRKDGRKPLVGDDVEMTVTDPKDMEGSLDHILPRRNSLIRPAAANVDQALLIFAAADPEPNLGVLDRLLIMMERDGVPCIVCFNKADLVTEEKKEAFAKIYRPAGYETVFTSTLTGEGMDRIRFLLHGKTTVVAGPSGAGKSSMTNFLQPEAGMETGEISRKLGRGRHTTRHAEIIPVEDRTYLVDTPGFTSIYLTGIEEQELRHYFPEFTPFEGQCRFQGCRHIHEPDCPVRDAVREGRICRERYGSYVLIHKELSEIKKY